MEPMNCTAKISATRAEAWVPSQNAEASLAALSEASGLPLDKCEVYRPDIGGGFGRRGGTQDYVHQAVAIAKNFPDVPVKMIWSREEDMAHDFYRPISQCKLSAGLDDNGNLVGLHARISGQSINAYLNPALISGGKDMRQLQGYDVKPGEAQLGYGAPNMLIEYVMRNTHVPVGPWRGVNTNQNAVYMECFMDEVAHAAGKDPVEFRRSLMAEYPKHRACLDAVAEKAEWGKPLPAGIHRGIAQFHGYGTYSAAVAEVSVSDDGKLKVHRLVLGDRIAAMRSIPTRSPRRWKARSPSACTAALYGEMSGQGRPHGADELRHLPDAAHGGDAEGRDHDHADLRLLGRHRRADHLRGHARRSQRDLCRDRQAGAQPALQEREAGVAVRVDLQTDTVIARLDRAIQ